MQPIDWVYAGTVCNTDTFSCLESVDYSWPEVKHPENSNNQFVFFHTDKSEVYMNNAAS